VAAPEPRNALAGPFWPSWTRNGFTGAVRYPRLDSSGLLSVLVSIPKGDVRYESRAESEAMWCPLSKVEWFCDLSVEGRDR